MERGNPGHASAQAVNPEAGDHPVSADPVEQAAAAAATRRSWKEFPYYPRRYGERGWRFSLSDSGWIQTLCNLGPKEAQSQVLWLSGLLTARGMPSYLMERHLHYLQDELVRPSPMRARRYEVLLDCAVTLRERRHAHIAEEAFESVSAAFERRVAAYAEAVPNMGRVIVAAVADERAGVVGAVSSVEAWACDPAAFDSVWVESVKQAIEAARVHRN
jgi:hypothetical protein